ncbi:MAG: RNA 2',3'-cyclic phosphodiesterase [Hydrogenophaga sp.]|nr:RNA 2',3'-cyclic phosphodiesterase [Hydrogenophaga sp.]MDO8903200.1 RNA 2',3'-cyclic phosphodiesterase [Hydrogenophaga sp.]
MPRAFLAISLPLSLRSTFVACRESLITHDPSWRGEKWVAEENLHVTLRFLGSVPEDACAEVADRVRDALSDVGTYRLRLDTVRAIPRPRSASLLWVGASAGAEDTVGVASRIAGATSFVDFTPDGREFKTHVTLCRARHPRRIATAALDEVEHLLRRSDERATTMSVREVTLFASTLTPRGPVYEELAIIPLGT